MDPVSLASSTITFITVVAALIGATAKALNAAKALEDLQKDFRYITRSLADSIVTLERLENLNRSIARLNSEELRNLNIPTRQLQSHLEITDNLSRCLETQFLGLKSRSRIFKSSLRETLRPGSKSELQKCWDQFKDSQQCLSLSLNILQSFVPIYIIIEYGCDSFGTDNVVDTPTYRTFPTSQNSPMSPTINSPDYTKGLT